MPTNVQLYVTIVAAEFYLTMYYVIYWCEFRTAQVYVLSCRNEDDCHCWAVFVIWFWDTMKCPRLQVNIYILAKETRWIICHKRRPKYTVKCLCNRSCFLSFSRYFFVLSNVQHFQNSRHAISNKSCWCSDIYHASQYLIDMVGLLWIFDFFLLYRLTIT